MILLRELRGNSSTLRRYRRTTAQKSHIASEKQCIRHWKGIQYRFSAPFSVFTLISSVIFQ